jgi:hypothetical protein
VLADLVLDCVADTVRQWAAVRRGLETRPRLFRSRLGKPDQHAKRAKKALDEAKISYQETAGEEYELSNKAGALAQCLEKLATEGVNLNSIHATAPKGGRKAVEFEEVS